MAQRARVNQDDEEPTADAESTDPFEAALDAAPYSEEPLTDEEREAMERGWQEYLRGESSPLEEVFDRLLGDETTQAPAAK